jgi:hypothetical protein
MLAAGGATPGAADRVSSGTAARDEAGKAASARIGIQKCI